MGVVPHPTILVEDINDAPIGTGPFVFDEWVPDKDFRAVRYDGYWREGLPYLDSIEYRPINEPQTRRASFDSGDVDVMTTAAARDSQDFEEQAAAGDDVQFYADRGENEENFVMLNLAAPPFDDVRVREALAYATDAEAYNNVVNQGAYRLARGPFVPESPYYIPSCTEVAEGEDCVDQPTFDPDKARELLAELEAERGGPVAFTLGNTPNETDRDQSALLQEMWQDVGFEVELSFTDQGQYIFDTLAGDYQAVVWRQFGQPDPDSDSQWWYSDSDLNFANIEDQEVDDALDRGRSLPDEADRVDAYADLQRRFAELLPYLWTYHTEWAIIAEPYVQDLPSGPLPDGSESMPFVTGTHRVGQMWIDPDLQ
jgi:ABC-type transport system substrate-binding protein